MRQRRRLGYSTSDLAREAGLHPNTIRRYVDWGLLPPVERSPAGYRRFTERHRHCLHLARLVYSQPYPGRVLRATAREVLRLAVANDWGGALAQAYRHLAAVRSEIAQADAAAEYLGHWAEAGGSIAEATPLQIRDAAERLGLTVDILRNWERNGLIEVPRDPSNRYRRYGSSELDRLRVIRMLSQAGHSQMAILRMLERLDGGGAADLRQALELPPEDGDVFIAADRWMTTLRDQEAIAQTILAYVADLA